MLLRPESRLFQDRDAPEPLRPRGATGAHAGPQDADPVGSPVRGMRTAGRLNSLSFSFNRETGSRSAEDPGRNTEAVAVHVPFRLWQAPEGCGGRTLESRNRDEFRS